MFKNIEPAVITASASIIAVAFTYFVKLTSELLEKRRQVRMNLMAIRNEIAVNKGIAEAIEKDGRTFGFKFIDQKWSTVDTSCIYFRGIPTAQLLEVFSYIQLFNMLKQRHSLMINDPTYDAPEDRLAQEHEEMVEIARKILNLSTLILNEIR